MKSIKFLMLVTIATTLSFPALACRGTSEYPELSSSIDQKLKASSLSTEKKSQIKAHFLKGMNQHTKAHTNNNMSQMKDSLHTLDSIKGMLK